MSAATTEAPRTRRSITPLPVRAWVDVAVLTVLALLALLGFAPSFSDAGYLLAGAGGLLVGTAAGILAALLRLGILTSALVAVAAYFLFGSAFAIPGRATGFVLPSLETLSGLVVGAVYGWADIVTLVTPVAAPDYMGVVPYLCGLLVGLVSSTLAGRWYATRPRGAVSSALGLLAPVTCYVVSVLTGTDEPYLAALRGVAFAVIALVWLTWRVTENANASTAARAAILRRRLIGIAVVVAISATGGVAAGAATAPASESRFVLRDQIVPPFDPLEYPSPLSGYRRYVVALADEVLFTVDGVSGGEYLRTATMDTYTGKLWTVAGADQGTEGSGLFRLVGGASLPLAALAPEGKTSRLDVEIAAYGDVWIPTSGYPRSVEFSVPADLPSTALRYNDATGVLVDTGMLGTGDRYAVDVLVPGEIDRERLGAVSQVVLPEPREVPDIVSTRALAFTSAFTTPAEKLAELETRLREDGFLSHGTGDGGNPSRAGHGADRMIDLLGGQYMVGDAEQFASAFALMARSLDYPARVVMGFGVPEGASGSYQVTGSDATAWVEVAFDGVGWVPFYPEPVDTEVPDEQTPKPRTEPLPQVRQPPLPPTGQQDVLSPVAIDDQPEPEGFVLPVWLGPVAAAVLIPLAVLLLPFLVIAAIKGRRRRRRRDADADHRRAAGAWDELVDVYAELGYQAPRKTTRIQLALLFEEQFRAELAARRREQQDAAQRVDSRLARVEAAAEAKRAKATGETSTEPTTARLGSLLEATVMRARETSTWRPGVPAADDPLPVLPGLRELAVATDASVFSGDGVSDERVDELWRESDEAAEAARRSVSWFRRRLSGYRLRLRRDVVAAAAEGLAGAARRARTGATPQTGEVSA